MKVDVKMLDTDEGWKRLDDVLAPLPVLDREAIIRAFDYLEKSIALARRGAEIMNTLNRATVFGPQPGTQATNSSNPPGIYTGGDDIAEIATYNNLDLALLTSELVKRMIQCLRECAMEAEIGHELGGFRVTLLQRYGLTDGSDPAFGPVKYPTPDRKEPLF